MVEKEKSTRKYPVVRSDMKKIQWTVIEMAMWMRLRCHGHCDTKAETEMTRRKHP